MLELKPLSKDSIDHAVARAKHYRLLNQPWQAESICKDILNIESDHQEAILILILSITDQFETTRRFDSEVKELCDKLDTEYARQYYRGIASERSGKAALKRNTPRAKYIAYDFYRKALDHYESAESIHPEGDEDTVLRWNSCVRAIQHFKLEPAPNEDHVQPFLDV